MLFILLAAGFGFLVSALSTRLLIKWLRRRGYMVEDYQKPGRPLVPRPGGPAIILSLVVGYVVFYAGTGLREALAIGLVVAIAGVIGLIDDAVKLGGVVKPILLIPAAIPLLIMGTYDFHLALPFFGAVRLPLIYPILALLAITVTANTINAIDVLNGVVSAFVTIAVIPVLVAFSLKGSLVGLGLAAILLASSLGFYLHHRYPSRIFPGDSGALALGAAYGATVIIGGVEVVGVVALLPAILNSFFYLSSVRRLVEHREVPRPIIVKGEELTASRDPGAPITLVRLIASAGPVKEPEAARLILYLTSYSALLAAITAFATWR